MISSLFFKGGNMSPVMILLLLILVIVQLALVYILGRVNALEETVMETMNFYREVQTEINFETEMQLIELEKKIDELVTAKSNLESTNSELENQLEHSEEEKLKSELILAKNQLIKKVEQYRIEMEELALISDDKLRQERKLQILSKMKRVRKQLGEYQALEEKVINKIVEK